MAKKTVKEQEAKAAPAKKAVKAKTETVKDDRESLPASEYEAKRKMIAQSYSNNILRSKALSSFDEKYKAGK